MNTHPLDDLFLSALSRFRLWPLPGSSGNGAEPPDYRLPENVARLLARKVLSAHRRVDLIGALFVDDDARPMAYSLPSLGYTGPIEVEPRRLVGPGMILDAAGMILFHNRPDGDLEPSAADLDVTRRLRAVGEVAGVRLLDHL
ncbi:MAG: hypothetical protein GY719_18485, partial [bacterium]|nr:hypothetical protein [bacterium]